MQSIGDEHGIAHTSPTITYRAIKEFHLNAKMITAYLKQLQLYFKVNDITKGRKAHVLIMVIGPKVYMHLRELLVLALRNKKKLCLLDEMLMEDYEQVSAESFNFLKKQQAAGKSLAEYQAELRSLARTSSLEAS